MSYPRNAASPERISVGPVVQISDGAVQSSGVSISVRGQGGASGAGGGTTAYDNGIVEYTPTQGETDFTSFVVVAYKTGCIPATVTVVTSASSVPGRTMPADGSITAAVVADGAIDAGAIASDAITAAKIASGAITSAKFAAGAIDAAAIATDAIDADAIKADAVTEIQNGLATASALTTLTGIFTGITSLAQWLGLIAGKQTGNSTARTELRATGAGSGTYDETTDSLEAGRDNIGTAGAGLTAADDAVITAIGALSIPTANQNADALLDRADGVETGLTFRQWLRLGASALFGKASGLGTTTAVYRDIGDTKARITATVDADGNRTAVTRDAT